MGVITPKNAGEIGWTTGSELFVKNLKRNNLIVEVEANPKQDLLIQFRVVGLALNQSQTLETKI